MMMHSHPMPIRDPEIPGVQADNVQLIQKHLRLTADQNTVPALLTLGHGWEKLQFNPCTLRSEP